MKTNLGPYNTTIVFQNFNPSLVPVDDVKKKIIDILGLDAQVAIAQFPDVTAIIVPNQQVSIISEGKRVQIGDTNVGDFTSRDIDKFLRLVKGVDEVFVTKKMTTQSFGFNYSYNIDLEGEETGNSIIFNKLISTSKVTKSLGTDTSASSLGFVVNSNGLRYELKIDATFGEGQIPTNKIICNANVHFEGKSLFSYSDLSNEFINQQKQTLKYFESLLS